MYRILWTKAETDGGWWVDVDATDAAEAAWNQAVRASMADPERPPVLVAITPIQ